MYVGWLFTIVYHIICICISKRLLEALISRSGCLVYPFSVFRPVIQKLQNFTKMEKNHNTFEVEGHPNPT